MADLKRHAARFLLRILAPRMVRDSSPYNRIWGHAIVLQLGALDEEAFRRELDAFYAQLDPEECAATVNLAAKATALERPGGYKADVLTLAGHAPVPPGRLDFWARRFGLARQLSIRADVIIVRAGDQIPPHGHSQVVSGFYVLTGRVAVRHYDRVEERDDHVLLRKSIDTEMGPGGYTTNSEYHQNIHWLLGIAPVSYLFRFTVTDVPVKRFSVSEHDHSRAYVDPTGAPDPSGLIRAPYVSEQAARAIPFR
ncbi:MAG TPA: hypothetical protein VGL65_08280 [Gemmatimonadales bacterium]|jgi:hypothetical protein